MEGKHSFNSYIEDKKEFESYISNDKTFSSYINNHHNFTVGLDKSIAPVPTVGILKYFALNIGNSIDILVSQIDTLLSWTIEVGIPSISTAIDDTLISVQGTINLLLDVVFYSPSMTAIMSMLQEMGLIEIDVPFQMQSAISESYGADTELELPPITMSLTITSAQYYMMNYYDSYLLSDLDANLLSDMDAVVT